MQVIKVKLRDLDYEHFVVLDSESNVRDAIYLLTLKGLKYGIVKRGTKVQGFVSRDVLEKAKSSDSLALYIKNFQKEIHQETEIEDLVGSFNEVILILNDQKDYVGILDIDTIIKALQKQLKFNKALKDDLDAIIDFSSDEIYVTDGEGKTLLVNTAFEENSGIPRDQVIGKNVVDLERTGVFRPSVTRMVLEQKKQVSIFQNYSNQTRVLVTGTPVFAEDGRIYRVITNARDTAKLNRLKAQLDEIEMLKDRYYQELLDLRKGCVEVGQIIANSKSMRNILNIARKMAEVDSTVLLLGETGVGKGILARYIHDNSKRKGNSFILINCGAIPENLLETELFGYEAGAFTGANQKGKMGKMELANYGTLFLDEIGELPLALQVKLLNVIEGGRVTRVGGTKEIDLSVRFIAATNRDLAKRVKSGDFREDLFFRLSVLPLEIPPLRQRKEDIIPLTERFLEKFNRKYLKNKKLDEEAYQLLEHYVWPGNVRELENLIERLIIVINEDIIEAYHLPEMIKLSFYDGKDNIVTKAKESLPLDDIIHEVEKGVLERLYHEYHNTYKIAALLNVNQSTIVRKLKKYNITKPFS
ncbi:MAG: sigma 54-interacting transcriptional regulator [Bacillota bacterium]